MNYVVIGVVIAVFLYTLFRALHLRLRGTRTVGRVTDLRKDSSGDTPVFYPSVIFSTSTGATVEVESGFAMSGTEDFFYVGRQVDILYLPHNPKVFVIAGYESETILYLLLLVAFVAGVFYWIESGA